jgi:4-amino-4-deoxy-L-arabinose transferase-like glycosyltransferase
MTSLPADATPTPRGGPSWWWFLAWLLIGAMLATAGLGALTLGIFVLAVAVTATALLTTRRGSLTGWPGAITGVGLPVLWGRLPQQVRARHGVHDDGLGHQVRG